MHLRIRRMRGVWVPLRSDLRDADPRFAEELTRDIYFQEYTPRAGDVVVHAGAGAGEEVRLLSRLVGADGRVFAIEAHPATAAALRQRCVDDELGNVVPVNVAVSDAPGSVSISDEESYLANRMTDAGGQRVDAVTLAAFFEQHGIERVDFLAMNIEGAELAALRGLGSSAQRVRNVAVQCHDFLADRGGDDANRTKAAVARLLADYGFTVNRRRWSDPHPWTRPFLYGTRRDDAD